MSLKFDWLRPFSSSWNNSLVFELAKDFKTKVLGSVPHETNWDDMKYLQALIARKLGRTRKAYLDGLPPAPGSSTTYEQKRSANHVRRRAEGKAARRTSRRKGVRRSIIN